MRRPGVAMMMSGLSASAVNCLSMLSPPTRRAIRRSFSFDILRANVSVFSGEGEGRGGGTQTQEGGGGRKKGGTRGEDRTGSRQCKRRAMTSRYRER